MPRSAATTTTARRARLRTWKAYVYKEKEGFEYDPSKSKSWNNQQRWERDENGKRIVVMRHHPRTLRRRKIRHYQQSTQPVVPRSRVVGFLREALADVHREFGGGADGTTKVSLSQNVKPLLNAIMDQRGNEILNLARRLHEHGHPTQYRVGERTITFAVHTVAPSWWPRLADDGVDDEPPGLSAARRNRRLAELRDGEPQDDDADDDDSDSEA